MAEVTYKAAKYLRLSRADDSGVESDSIQNQRKMLDSFIASQPDIEAVCERVDDGISGVIFDRKAFKEMMADIEAGTINCVIVKDLSRLGREYIETGRYLRRIFPAYGVRFIAVNDNIDTLRDSGDDLIVSVKSIINDAYCRDISVKTRSALGIKRENGDYVGAFPVYGYRKSPDDKNLLVVDEYPAGVVRDIFRMKLEGLSALKISEELNSRGILSPMEYKKSRGLPHGKNGFCNHEGAKWSATAIIRILQDATYTGTLLQGRQGTVNYKIKDIIKKPQNEWIRTENAHEAIIKPLDFDLAQRIMQLDTRTTPGGKSVYLFSGVLICGCCGARMTRKTNTVCGKKYHYYYCPTTKKRGCPTTQMVKESDLIGCVLENIKAHIANVASLDAILSGTEGQRAASAIANQYRTAISDNKAQLAHITGFKSKLYENMVSGVISKEDYKSLKAGYSEDEERLRAAIEKLDAELSDVLSGTGERLKWIENFKRFDELTELDRRTVVNLIQSIKIISKDELQITFNYQLEYDTARSLVENTTESGLRERTLSEGVA